MNIFKFKKIFSSLISKKKTLKLLIIINNLYKKKILNEKLILNIIKAFVIIFYLNKDAFNNYYNLLVYLNNNEFISNKIFKKIKLIDLQLQFELPIKIVDTIIIVLNNFILEITESEYNIKINMLYDILTSVMYTHASIEYKIKLFLYFLKESKERNKINMSYDIKEVKSIINNFID